jgi:hypothetical protein
LYEQSLLAGEENNQAAKQAALESCAGLHKVYLDCLLQANAFNWCWPESSAFWRCYGNERGFSKTAVQATLDRERLLKASAAQHQQAAAADEQGARS